MERIAKAIGAVLGIITSFEIIKFIWGWQLETLILTGFAVIIGSIVYYGEK